MIDLFFSCCLKENKIKLSNTYLPLLIPPFGVFPIPSSVIVLLWLFLALDMPGRSFFVIDNPSVLTNIAFCLLFVVSSFESSNLPWEFYEN
jgi:hypothetical protein